MMSHEKHTMFLSLILGFVVCDLLARCIIRRVHGGVRKCLRADKCVSDPKESARRLESRHPIDQDKADRAVHH